MTCLALGCEGAKTRGKSVGPAGSLIVTLGVLVLTTREGWKTFLATS